MAIDIGALQGSISINGISEAVEGLQDVRDSSESIESRFDSLIGTTKNLVTGLLTIEGVKAAFESTVGKANELDQAMNNLQASIGASSEEMDKFNSVIKDVYSQNYGESFEDISNAVGLITQQLGEMNEADLTELTTDLYAMQDTFDLELQESIPAVKILMEQFGISAEEATNLMAQGFQNGLNSGDDLADTIKEYSTFFADSGLSAEDFFSVLQSGLDNGVMNSDKMADMFKELSINLKDADVASEFLPELGLDVDSIMQSFAKGGEDGQKALADVVNAIVAIEDPIQQNQIGVGLMGSLWEDVGIDGVNALANINSSFDSTINTMQSIKEIKYDSFTEGLAGLGRTLETSVLIPLGEKLLPYLESATEWAGTQLPIIIDNVTNFFTTVLPLDTLCATFERLLPILAGVVAGFASFQVITTVSSLFTSLSGVITTVTTAIASAGSVTGALSAALAGLFSPVTIAVAAIGALVAALVYLYENNEEIRTSLNECWEAIKTLFESVCTAIKGIVEEFVATFNALWAKYGSDVMEIFDAAWNYIAQLFNVVIDLITDTFNVFSLAFQGDWGACWEAVKTLASNLWNNITDLLIAWLDLLVTCVVNIGHAMWEAGSKIFSELWRGAQEIWDNITSWLSEAINNPVDMILNIGGALYNAGTSIFNSLLDGLMSVWNSIESWVSDKISWLTDKVQFWKDSSDSMSSSGYDGSHRIGLDKVPYDGYTAQMHAGEMILTQAQADRYRKNEQGTTIVNNTMDTGPLESKIDKLIAAINKMPTKMQVKANMG